MNRTSLMALTIAASALACADPVAAPVRLPTAAVIARSPGGPAPRYVLRFISDSIALGDGEIQSGWFPDTGVVLDSRAPWKSLVVRGTTIDLINSTHGRWTGGTCATFASSASTNVTSWDIAGTYPLLSFAGRWFGTLSITQGRGTSVSFDGDRVVDGIVSAGDGGIHNVVTNANVSRETKDPSGAADWFRLEITDAAMKFGSASSPDGLSNPAGTEVACANFTIVAMKASLIEP